MLSKTVKDELQERLPGVTILDNFGSSESGAHGSVRDGASGPRFVMRDDTSVLDDELVPLTPGDGRIGRLARTGRIPIGYYKDPVKTGATFPVDARGVRWSVPGDLASVEPDGTIVVHGRGSGSINSGGEKIFPEEVEAAVKTHPACSTPSWSGSPTNGSASGWRWWSPEGPGGRPRLASCRTTAGPYIAGYKLPRQLLTGRRRPPDRLGQARRQGGQGLF